MNKTTFFSENKLTTSNSTGCSLRLKSTPASSNDQLEDRVREIKVCRWKILYYSITSIFLIVFVMVLTMDFKLYGRYSFFCHDPSINKPYMGDNIGTILLIMGSLLIGILFFFIDSLLFLKKEKLFSYMNLWKVFIEGLLKWLISFGCLGIILTVIKLICAYPRPHFIDVCNPIECRNSSTRNLITNFTCQNTKNFKNEILIDSFLSFPSGTSSATTYVAFTLAFIINNMEMGANIFLPALKNLIHTFLFIICFYVCCSRIGLNLHHASDIVFGGLIAVIYGFIFIQHYKAFKKEIKTSN